MKRVYVFKSSCVWSGVILAVLLLGGSAMAQLPEKFTNLQVLPADIERQELVGMMRGFAQGLGVRCQHCHVGEEGMDLSEFDFASDAKESKKIARVMLKMTNEINSTHLPAIGRSAENLQPVTCYTCHHGIAQPSTLEQELMKPILEEGAEAGIARYRLLRDKYYGQGVFDFGERSLLGLANDLARQHQKLEEAAALLRLNLEFYPQSAFTYFSLGELLAFSGDREGAIQNLEKGLEIAPDSERFKRRLEALRKQVQQQ